MQKSLLRLARCTLRADGTALVLPTSAVVGDPLPWRAEDILELIEGEVFEDTQRLIAPVLNGALVVWCEDERSWSEHDRTVLKEFSKEMEPRLTREGMLAAVVDGTDAVVFVKDTSGRYLEANPAAARLLGKRRAQIIGKTDEQLFPQDTAQSIQDHDAKVLRENRTLKVEEVVPDDGLLKTYLSLKFPLLIAGEKVGICGISTDVTDRLEMAQNLSRTKERLNLALEGVGLGLWMCDLPLDKLEWTDRCKQHFGLAPENDIDIDLFYQLLHPDDREPTRLALEKAIDQGTIFDVLYRTQGPDGVQRWIRAIGRCHYRSDGTPSRIDGLPPWT